MVGRTMPRPLRAAGTKTFSATTTPLPIRIRRRAGVQRPRISPSRSPTTRSAKTARSRRVNRPRQHQRVVICPGGTRPWPPPECSERSDEYGRAGFSADCAIPAGNSVPTPPATATQPALRRGHLLRCAQAAAARSRALPDANAVSLMGCLWHRWSVSRPRRRWSTRCGGWPLRPMPCRTKLWPWQSGGPVHQLHGGADAGGRRRLWLHNVDVVVPVTDPAAAGE